LSSDLDVTHLLGDGDEGCARQFIP